MLKKILLSSAALALTAGFASAADLPSRMAPAPVYAPLLPVFTWTGAYFGVNAGYAFDHEGRFVSSEVFARTGTRTAKVSSDGFTGGGQIGYNYQLGAGNGVVLGVEADAAYTDLGDTRSQSYGLDGGALFGTTTTYKSSLNYLGTVRGRVGYAFNQFLIYGTGGFAYGGVDNRITVGGIAAGRANDMETGYAVGGGIEYALPTNTFLNVFKSSAVTLKAEYMYYDLGNTNIAVNTPGGVNTFNTKVSNNGNIARVGLNYKFGSF